MHIPFINRPKHQEFKYVPRFYDPDKEDLKHRLNRIQLEKDDSAEAMKSRISSGLKSSRSYDPSLRRRLVIKSNMIILIVIALLLILTFFFLDNYLPVIFEAFD